MFSGMCGRSTYKLTWEEIVALYQLTLDQPARNTQARYNGCTTTTIDSIPAQRTGRRSAAKLLTKDEARRFSIHARPPIQKFEHCTNQR